MNVFSRFLSLLLLLSTLHGTDVPPYLFETIDIADGLSQNSVLCIAKDKYGFIWLGTEDGLNRYDGITFKVFRHDPLDPTSINSSSILSSLIDRQGNLWVGTYASGLNKYVYETENFIQYPHDPLDSLRVGEGSIYTLLEDQDGYIWAGTSGGGLFRVDPETGKSIAVMSLVTNKGQLSDPIIFSLFEDHNSQLWISTAHGLNVLDLKTYSLRSYFRDPDNSNSLFDDYTNTVHETFDGENYRLWIGSNWGGLDLFDSTYDHFIHYGFKSAENPDFPETSIMWMLQESSNRIWLGTASKGILIMDANGLLVDHIKRKVYDQTALQDDIINTMYDDGDIIWVGTSGGGVSKYIRNRKQFYSLTYDPLDPSGLHDNRILKIVNDSKGNFWIATWTKGLSLYNPKNHTFTIFQHNPDDPGSLSDNSIQDIMVDRHDNLWVLSASINLDILRAGSQTFEHIKANFDDPSGLQSDYLTVVYEDYQGLIWFGTWNQGLIKLDPKTMLFQTMKDPATHNVSLGTLSFYSLFMDSRGTLWIGAENEGLLAFDQNQMTLKQFKAIPGDPYALPHNDVICFHEDPDGTLWLGTYGGGLTRFDPSIDTFESFGLEQGLLSASVYKIFDDRAGDLWLSTNNGLARFSKQLQTFQNYGISDGVLSKEFNPAGCKDANGWLYFGGIKGITYFDPIQINDNTHIPPLQFTGMSIMNHPIQINEIFHGRTILNQALAMTPRIQLYPEDLFFSIRFASLDYYHSKRNQFAYQLEGFDDEWRYIGYQREVTFTNLPAGSYTLHVKGSNNDSVWNEAASSLPILVHPIFYKTWWFKAIVAIFIGLAAFFIYHFRTAFLIRRSKELKEHNIQLNAQIESRHEAHRRARERADYFRAVISQSPIPMAIHNMSGNITYLNQGWVTLWNSRKAEDIIRDYQVDKDPLAQQLGLGASFKEAVGGQTIEHPEVTFISQNGHRKTVHILLYPLQDKVEPSNQIMISLEDITEIVQHRTLLEKSLNEKELLLKEVHHRVKNNLQIIASLLGLQKAGPIAEESAQILEEFRSRVNSMALVHDALYRSPEFDNIDIATYIKALSADLQSAFSQNKEPIQIVTDIPAISLSVDFAVPCGLLINELVTNSLKYAFPDKQKPGKQISIRFTKMKNNWLRIEVMDNGVGFQKPVVWDSVKSLGLYLVKILGEQQLMGTVQLKHEPGAHFTIEFPLDPDYDT